ncbi:MAG: transposase [Planctomycetota bacterium]|jgi:hypothetical protein
MSRPILSLSREQLTAFDLDAFIARAEALNQQNRDIFSTPFPKPPSRWVSHYEFTPHPIEFTSQGDVDGGLSWLVGATLDFSFTRSLCAPYYGTRGGSCYDPASLVVLEVAAKVDQYVDYAQFCRDLHQSDKGRRYRQLAGLHDSVPGEDDLCHFRYRIGDEVIEQIMAVAVDFLHHFGLIQGELLSTDGQLEPSYSRYKGCTYACEDCQAFALREADRQALGEQLQSGAKRLQITCPFPDAVAKVRKATAKKGTLKDPKVALLEIETVPEDKASVPQRQQVAKLLGLGQDEVPPLRMKWCHLSQGPNGELVGNCLKRPSDLEAKVGVHVNPKDPSKKEEVFGYVHLKTTALHQELGLELPVGNSTYPANAKEGSEFIAHRAKLAVPVLPGQVQLGDSANDITANYEWLHERGAIAVFDYNRRNEHIDETSLLNRGYDANGTPYAPCGRLCRSNGYDYQAQSRQYVCGFPCPPDERQHCPHRYGVMGYCHRMSFKDHPRLIGPIQRGTPAWHRLYGARSSSERTNSYDQEVIGKAHPLRMRGLKAFRFAGAIRTLAQLLRRALNFVLDVTYTLDKASLART